MSIKFIPKVGAALIILAIVLIFLGVNYVPKIFALSSSRGNASDPLIVTRLNYVDELYPRAIAPQLSLAGSDWIERHPLVIASQMSLAGSDWIERHPLVIASQVSFAGSDPLERALRVAVPQASFLGSDPLERALRVAVPQVSSASSDPLERRTIYPRVK